MCERMPSLEEQDIVEKYVNERKLIRPNTNLKKAICWTSGYITGTLIFSAVVYILFLKLGVFANMPETIFLFMSDRPHLFNLCFTVLSFAFTGIFFCRMALIGCIRLYQHYADEDVRRRCLLMPTCSEYAILSLKKYGIIIGLIMAGNRLFRKCRGNVYRIDFP